MPRDRVPWTGTTIDWEPWSDLKRDRSPKSSPPFLPWYSKALSKQLTLVRLLGCRPRIGAKDCCGKPFKSSVRQASDVRSFPTPTYRSPTLWKARASATTLLLVALVTACAPLSQSVQTVEGANPEDVGSVVRLSIDTTHPVLLRAVDETFLARVQVSSALRSYTYVLHAGTHVLWVSSAPYGLPLVPQRIKCYVLNVRLSAGASYTLRFDVPTQVPVLVRATGSEPEAVGVLVDEPLVFERSCRWR